MFSDDRAYSLHALPPLELRPFCPNKPYPGGAGLSSFIFRAS